MISGHCMRCTTWIIPLADFQCHTGLFKFRMICYFWKMRQWNSYLACFNCFKWRRLFKEHFSNQTFAITEYFIPFPPQVLEQVSWGDRPLLLWSVFVEACKWRVGILWASCSAADNLKSRKMTTQIFCEKRIWKMYENKVNILKHEWALPMSE